MEQNHNTPASSAEQQDTSATKVYRNKKGKKATIREFFLHLHKEILDGEQTTFKLGSCSRGQDRRLVETVVGASKRAFDNIIVCKAAQAREEKPSSSNIHKGPIDVGVSVASSPSPFCHLVLLVLLGLSLSLYLPNYIFHSPVLNFLTFLDQPCLGIIPPCCCVLLEADCAQPALLPKVGSKLFQGSYRCSIQQ